MAKSIFRRAALDRLTTPEHFDRTLTVTTPMGWSALCVLGVIGVVVAVWSVRGEIPTFVQAHGILLNQGGKVIDAVSSGTGALLRVIPAPGDRVQEGAVVAETTNQEIMERHRSALALVEERARARDDLKAALAAEAALVQHNAARQRARLDELERGARQSVAAAEKTLENHLRLFEERIVTRVTVERSRAALDRARRELFNLLSERDNLESGEVRRENEYQSRLSEMESRLQAARRQVNELGAVLDTQRILAPVSGQVTEVKAPVGAVLGAGQPVLSIRTGEQRLEALVYVSPADGKKVDRGMPALVSPSTVQREEYGAIRATVESISAFPVSRQGMIAVLQNQALARTFSESGPPYESRIVLEADPTTASGFAWTSPRGANETLTSGTLVSVEIKVERQAPITLVAPLLGKMFGL